MNDNELITAVRQSVVDVHTTTPVEQILRRGRAARARRRIPVLIGALGAAAAAALAVTTLLPGTHHPRPQPHAQLAAWTVTTQADGNIRVAIRELHNPAGLQARLRRDGVPASVTFIGHPNPACRPWPGAPLYGRSTPAGTILFNDVFPPMPPGAPSGVIVIRPSALPSGGGVLLEAGFHGHSGAIGAGLVHASKRCTGS
jgi:hypothetical protein